MRKLIRTGSIPFIDVQQALYKLLSAQLDSFAYSNYTGGDYCGQIVKLLDYGTAGQDLGIDSGAITIWLSGFSGVPVDMAKGAGVQKVQQVLDIYGYTPGKQQISSILSDIAYIIGHAPLPLTAHKQIGDGRVAHYQVTPEVDGQGDVVFHGQMILEFEID